MRVHFQKALRVSRVFINGQTNMAIGVCRIHVDILFTNRKLDNCPLNQYQEER